MKKATNEFDSFLNECQTYVWEWYIPEQKVRFGIPSLNSLWIDDRDKNIKLPTMLERVHPDDIEKVLVRHTSPLYKSDKMFEVDLRLNVAAELTPDGQSSGEYEWYGFRGKTITRDRLGRPTYVRGVAINLDQRYRAQLKLLHKKEKQLADSAQKVEYCSGVMHEVSSFLSNLAENASSLIDSSGENNREAYLYRLSELKNQAAHILDLTDKYRAQMGINDLSEAAEIVAMPLWEHLAELQQIHSLRFGSHFKLYFSNLYDNQQIWTNVKLFDSLIDNVLTVLSRVVRSGYVSVSYVFVPESDTVRLSLSCAEHVPQTEASQSLTYSESSLGQGVCRLMAQRLRGDMHVLHHDNDRLEYQITLPIDARNSQDLTEDELDDASSENESFSHYLPHVLIGLEDEPYIYQNQHLFDVTICRTTHDIQKTFDTMNPDIVFLDYRLAGKVQPMALITHMHQQHPDTPIIVMADFAPRSLHKEVRQLGARYVITPPLSLRKINMMIKRFLK